MITSRGEWILSKTLKSSQQKKPPKATLKSEVFCLLMLNCVFSWWFNVGLLLLGICLCLATFCIVYLEWFRGIVHYDQEYPAIPPITTAAFIAASCRYIRQNSCMEYVCARFMTWFFWLCWIFGIERFTENGNVQLIRFLIIALSVWNFVDLATILLCLLLSWSKWLKVVCNTTQ